MRLCGDVTMRNKILTEDIPKVKQLLADIFGTGDYENIARMGGLTNHTYKVTLSGGDEYIVRIPGEGTEEMIVRSDELTSTKLACELKIDADLLYFGRDGSKVTRFIPNAVTMSSDLLRQPKHIEQVAEILNKLHTCGADTGVPFDVFDMAAEYEKIIVSKNIPLYDDYPAKKVEIMQIKREIDASVNAPNVPCHNDPLCENWIEGDGRMYLIDWEYAGMNDGMWDVADVSIEASFDKDDDTRLLTSYLGRTPTLSDRKHFLASKIFVDFLWTLWAKTRVPYDGQPMEDWALERYTRLKGFLDEFKQC